MEPSTPATPAPADPDASSANETTDAHSSRPARAEFHGAHLHSLPLRRMIKDTTAMQPERRDSCDSMHMRRSNTGWSVASAAAASVNTDYTEPESPDAIDEDLNFDADPYGTSLPRLTSFLSRSGFCPPSRASSFASTSSDNGPLSSRSRHSRFADMASSPRRTRFERAPFSLARSGPGPSSRRESVQTPYSPILEDDSPISIAARDTEEPIRRSPSPSVHEVEDKGKKAESPVTTEDGPAQETSELPSGESESALDEDTPDSMSDAGFTPHQTLDDGLVQDFLDRALRHGFGVDIDELEHNAASAAYESISYCLDELAYIVQSSGMHAAAGPSIHQAAPREPAGSKNIAIQPANNSGSSGGKGGKGSSNKKKRLNDRMDEDDFDANDGDENGERRPPGGKKQKVMDGQNLSCPFRKRNPIKFNVRDFQSCAVQSFPDIPQLKRHIKNFHRQRSISQFTCPRCMRDMGTQEALIEHQQVERHLMCDVRAAPTSADPEDGITAHVEDILNGRKANSKVDCWPTLWDTLFPGDQNALDHNFVPPTELDEVHRDFKIEFRNDSSALRQQIQEEFPDSADHLLGIFETHTHRIVEACRARTGGMQGRPRRTRNQGGRQGQATTPAATPATATTSPLHTRRPSLSRSIHRIQSRDTIGSHDNSGGFPSTHGTPMSDDVTWPTPITAQALLPNQRFTPSPGGYQNPISPISAINPSSMAPLANISGQAITIQPPAPIQFQQHNQMSPNPSIHHHHHRAHSGDSAIHLDSSLAMAQIGGDVEAGYNLPVRTGQPQQNYPQGGYHQPSPNPVTFQLQMQQRIQQMQQQEMMRMQMQQQHQQQQQQQQQQQHQHQHVAGRPTNQLMTPRQQQEQAFYSEFEGFEIPGLDYGNGE